VFAVAGTGATGAAVAVVVVDDDDAARLVIAQVAFAERGAICPGSSGTDVLDVGAPLELKVAVINAGSEPAVDTLVDTAAAGLVDAAGLVLVLATVSERGAIRLGSLEVARLELVYVKYGIRWQQDRAQDKNKRRNKSTTKIPI
jgi:hypothetical protein